MRQHAPSSCRRAGFTLVELLLVLTLLSVTVGLVAPDIAGRMQRNRLEDLSFRVSLMMREAYQQAVFSGRVRWVGLNSAGRVGLDSAGRDALSGEDAIGVFDGFPGGQLLEGTEIRPLLLPEWAEIDGLEDGWCARPEGFCDEGPVRIRDRETGTVSTLRFRPYDGELLDDKEENDRGATR